ncbi:acyl-CoA dehydrogenase family protein [Patulibacter sp. S7RM1-6]
MAPTRPSPTPAPAQPDEVAAIAARVRRFVDEEVVPLEADGFDDHGVRPDVRARLQERARAAGVFAPTAPVALGGLGLDVRGQVPVLEAAGRSLLGPQALNCAAPDEGNVHLLDVVGMPEQRERYLAPLCAGRVRSCFSMTEPAPGAGSDPSMLRTTATKVDGGWRIDGHKWFTTGAEGAGFAICMARTGGDDRRPEATMFLVDLPDPDVEIRRAVRTTDPSAVGGHCEVVYHGVTVGDDAVLGRPGEGFRYAQVRLAPARLTHCMRWLGAAQAAHERTVAHVARREAFGSRLGELGLVQGLLADNEIDLQVSRAMVRSTAELLDAGGDAKQESAIAKVFVSEAVGRVVDRAVQMHGGMGVSEDTRLGWLLSAVRPFRIYDGPSETHRWAIARRLVRAARPTS